MAKNIWMSLGVDENDSGVPYVDVPRLMYVEEGGKLTTPPTDGEGEEIFDVFSRELAAGIGALVRDNPEYVKRGLARDGREVIVKVSII